MTYAEKKGFIEKARDVGGDEFAGVMALLTDNAYRERILQVMGCRSN